MQTSVEFTRALQGLYQSNYGEKAMLTSKDVRNSSGHLKITATVFHITSQQSCYQMRYRSVDGSSKLILIGRELFSKPATVVDILLKAHAALPDDRKAAVELVKRAIRNRSAKQFQVTNCTGWYDGSFVYLTKTYGTLRGKLRHEGLTDIDPALGLQAGTAREWRRGMKRPCRFSDFLVFALSVPASGPLLELIGEDEGAIYHFQPAQRSPSSGKADLKVRSSSGKTLAARAGLSTIGRCRKSDLVTFGATERGIEDYCFAHNNMVAFFDEEGRGLTAGQGVKPSILPYLVTSGAGKLRSKKAMQDPNLKNLRWSLPALSTGENPLDDPKRASRPEGAQARMIPIPVPPGGEGGIFNRVVGSHSFVMKRCRKLAKLVEDTVEENYGVLMPGYLQQIVKGRPALDRRVRQVVDRFVRTVGAHRDPWEKRFASKFGIVFASAILLSEFGLAPWSKERAKQAMLTTYQSARASSISTDEATQFLIRRLVKLVNAGKRFPKIKKGQHLHPERASCAWGAVTTLPGTGRVLAVPLARVTALLRPFAVTDAVLRNLSKHGDILKSSDGKLTREIMLKGLTGSRRRRLVCFDYGRLKTR